MSGMYEHCIFIFSGVSLAFLASVCVAEPRGESRVPAREPVEEEEGSREGKGNLKIEIIRLDIRLLKIRLPLVAYPI